MTFRVNIFLCGATEPVSHNVTLHGAFPVSRVEDLIQTYTEDGVWLTREGSQTRMFIPARSIRSVTYWEAPHADV